MATYYVDADNTYKERLRGIEWLSKKDLVRVYHAHNNPVFASEKNQKNLIDRTRAQVSFHSITAAKNAVDFGITIDVILSLSKEEQEKVFLVSEDKDFNTISDLIRSRGIDTSSSIETVSNIREGIIKNPDNITNVNFFKTVMQEQFGNESAQAMFAKFKELILLDYQKEQEKKEDNNRASGFGGFVYKILKK